MVVLEIAGGEHQGHGTPRRLAGEPLDESVVGAELLKVPPPELLEPLWLVPEPGPQLRRRGELL